MSSFAQPGHCEGFRRHLGQPFYGQLENVLAVHERVVAPLAKHLLVEARVESRRRGFRRKAFGKFPVGMQRAGQNSHRPVLVDALQTDRAGPVTENNGHVPPPGGDIEPGAVNLRAHQKDPLGDAAADIGIRRLKPVKKTGALLPDIEGGGRFQAEFVLQQASRTREKNVRAEGRENNQVEALGCPAGPFERDPGGLQAQVRGTHAAFLRYPIALFDAGALDDPLIRGVHPLAEILVGDLSGRQVSPAGLYHGSFHSVPS